MQKVQCLRNCTVESFDKLSICRQQSCNQPSLRCSECFSYAHVSQNEKKKKYTHQNEAFSESAEYKNFVNLMKIQKIMKEKIKKSMGKIKGNFEDLAMTAYYQSQFFKQIFDDANTVNQFAIFRQIYYGRPRPFLCSPSSDFVFALIMFNDKKFEKVKNQLYAPSPEEQMLIESYNIVSGQDSSMLQNFIEEEQKFFIDYCENLQKQKGDFDASQYLIVCQKRQNKNPLYFRRQFENFIEQKYWKNPAQQGIFTLAEYSQYIWENLILYVNQTQVSAYFNHYVDSFAIYSKYCTQSNMELSLLNFKMWKSYSIPFDEKNLKNRYFLVCFISAYVQYLIDFQNGGGQLKAKNWLQYLEYLKDYVSYMKQYNEEFINFTHYRQYYLFRKQFEKFYGFIKQSKQIVFNKEYIVEYMNKVFKEGVKLSNKNYKVFLEGKEDEIKAKQQELKKKFDNLREQLEEEEGSKFYFTVFDNFVADTVENDLPLNKQSYFAFKKNVLDQVSEDYIKNENEKMMMEMKNIQEKKQEKKEKISNVVSHSQTKLHEAIDKNIDQEDMEEEEIENEIQVCPCCLGDYEECQEPECQMMGYCVTCSL